MIYVCITYHTFSVFCSRCEVSVSVDFVIFVSRGAVWHTRARALAHARTHAHTLSRVHVFIHARMHAVHPCKHTHTLNIKYACTRVPPRAGLSHSPPPPPPPSPSLAHTHMSAVIRENASRKRVHTQQAVRAHSVAQTSTLQHPGTEP